MGLDLSSWYSVRRTVRGIADAAAVGATYARLEHGPTVTQAQLNAAALDEATRNGYVDDGNNTLTITSVSVTNGAVNRYVEASARIKAPVYFTSLVMGDVYVSADAAAGTQVLGDQCIIALEETAQKAIEFSGTAVANIGCGVTSNSSHSRALYVGGNATLVANPAQAYGDIYVGNGASLVSEYPLMPFSPRVPDPLEDVPFPDAPSDCDYVGDLVVNNGDSVSLAPDVSGGSYKICGDLRIHGDVTLASGTYFVDGGDFRMESSDSTITGSGVAILLTGDTESDVGNIYIHGQSTVTLSASDVTEFEGVVIAQSRDAPENPGGADNTINGGANIALTGIVYFPQQPLSFSGNSSNGDGCVQVIARMVTFTGTSTIDNIDTVCADIGVSNNTVGQEQVILVE